MAVARCGSSATQGHPPQAAKYAARAGHEQRPVETHQLVSWSDIAEAALTGAERNQVRMKIGLEQVPRAENCGLSVFVVVGSQNPRRHRVVLVKVAMTRKMQDPQILRPRKRSLKA
jgi:hypothetical protein